MAGYHRLDLDSREQDVSCATEGVQEELLDRDRNRVTAMPLAHLLLLFIRMLSVSVPLILQKSTSKSSCQDPLVRGFLFCFVFITLCSL